MYWTVILLIASVSAYDWQQYDGYKLIHFWPLTQDQIKSVRQIEEREGVLVMKDLHRDREVDYFVSSNDFDYFISILNNNHIRYQVSTRDITAELKKEWESILTRGYPHTMVYDKDQFNTREDIEAELDNLASQCADVNLVCSTEYLPGPPLHEGQQLKVFHLTGGENPRNSILWESLIHAREWLAGATLMNILDKMVKGYGTDDNVTALIDNYDFHFIPIMNPDGYQHTWDDERLWRKNRRVNEGSSCLGVDLNRNYDCNWGDPGASDLPCSATYRGPSSASEPESETVVNYVMSHTGPAWIMDVSIHTYGRYILVPYGNCTNAPNWETGLRNVTMAGCTAIEDTFNTEWSCGNTCEVLCKSLVVIVDDDNKDYYYYYYYYFTDDDDDDGYNGGDDDDNFTDETSGGSIDWMMETAGMPYTFVPELRGVGFVVDPDQIPLSTEEVWNGLVAMVKTMMVMPSPKRN
ncbi:hypothetical protein LSH36_143g01032 [Paralvinella palmiformis]|uniref:Peptidase M14 domain-containing protein n=1 Tax=Paralvinella palmiformis TaxID=53620 RepID=A0AAD9JUZ4_9ANNE|nr:hypothetical protein LSH36_143g01032 [Paralvinella palmiformis]